MTRIAPSEFFIQARGAGGAPAAPLSAVELTQLPTALARSVSGTVVNGTVIQGTLAGVTEIKTQQGILALRTVQSYPIGSEMTLRLLTSGSHFRAVILSVELPAGGAQAARGAPASPLPAAPITIADPPPGLLKLAGNLSAPKAPIVGTVVSGDNQGNLRVQTEAGTLSLRVPQPLATGSKLLLQIHAPGSILQAQIVAVRPPGTEGLAVQPPGTEGPVARPAPTPGTVLSLESLPAAARVAPGASITATVIGHEPGGQARLQTEFGILTTRAPMQLNVGTQLVLQLNSAGAEPRVTVLTVTGATGTPATGTSATGTPATGTPAPSPATPTGAHVETALSLAREWPALGRALETLQQAGGVAAQAIPSMVPAANPHIASTMLFFMIAVSRGDIRAWLGDAAAKVLSGSEQGTLMSMLGEDFRRLSRFAGGSDEGGWKTYFIPFHDGEHLRQIHFFLRDPRREEQGDGDEPALTRFVFQLEMSRLGEMQLDGLTGKGRFDLMVRSKQPLPSEVRAGVRELFASALSDMGAAGEIAFQIVERFPTTPLEETLEDDGGVLA